MIYSVKQFFTMIFLSHFLIVVEHKEKHNTNKLISVSNIKSKITGFFACACNIGECCNLLAERWERTSTDLRCYMRLQQATEAALTNRVLKKSLHNS